jgi:outer membrane protein assembly factor BamB
MNRPLVVLSLALLAACGRSDPVASADWWPQMRGPTAQGVATTSGVPITWSELQHIAWKTPIPGEGWSSPVVGTDAVFLTSALGNGRSLHAYRIDLASGRVDWDVEVFVNAVVPEKHARNTHASPTPVVQGDRLYVHFGGMGTACLSIADGRTLWANRDLAVDHEVGPGGSPVVYRDVLLLTCDGVDVQYGAALDARTGALRWRKDRSATGRLAKVTASLRKSFGTPFLVTVDGTDQALSIGAERLYAHDPLTGDELWHVDFSGFSNASMPVSDGKLVIFNTAFTSSQLWAVRLGGASGDVTASHVVWKAKFSSLSQPSPILYAGRVYAVNDSGILVCLDAATGTEVYKERIGSDFAASPVLADGRLYFFDARGKATVVQPGDAFRVLATNTLEAGCMASPAVAGGSLVVRTKTHLYRIAAPAP